MGLIETAFALDPVTLAAFMAASVVLYLTPGADMMFTIACGLQGGARAGMAAAVGISAGVLTHVILAAAGLAALMAAYPAALVVIRYAGAAYLLWMAWQAWTEPPDVDSPRKGRRSATQAILRGYVTNMLNPKVALFILAFLPQFTDPAIGPVWQQILLLGALLAAGGLVTDGAYGLFAGALAARVRRYAKTMNRVSALLYTAIAARLAAG